MKNFIEAVYKLMFVAGVLCLVLGIMSIFLINGQVEKYKQLESSGEKIRVEILEKKTSRSPGNTISITNYFNIKYLGKPGKNKFSVIQAMPHEFKAYDAGSMVTVVYDPQEPRMAEIVKTPQQMKKIKQKPYKLLFFGLMLIVIARVLRKVYARR